MINIEQTATIGIIGVVVLTGFLLARETETKTKELAVMVERVATLTKRLEIEAAKQPDAIHVGETNEGQEGPSRSEQTKLPEMTAETKEEYVKRNTAPVERIEFADMLELRVGDTVIYASGAQGRVLRIAPMEGSWVVETTHGKGEYMRWGTEAHDGDGIRGVVK